MTMDKGVIGILMLVFFVGFFIVGTIAWGFAAYYMIKTLNRFHPQRKWGQFIPISLFTPWFFTDEGNKYRVKLLKASALFIAMVLGGFGVGLISEMVTGENIFRAKPTAEKSGWSSNPAVESDASQPPLRAAASAPN